MDSPEPVVKEISMASPEAVVKDFLRRLHAESQAPAEKAGIEEPSTPPRTGAGVKIERTGSRDIEQIAMAGLRDAIQSSKTLDGLVDAVKDAKSLLLQRGAIGDKGVSALARAFRDGNATKLLHLDLSDNEVTEQGFGELTQVLASGVLSGLEYFNLAHNLIREEGSGMLARIFQIGRLPALQHLNLSHCYIGEKGIKSITDAMQSGHFSSWSLQFLDLSANAFGEEGVVALSKILSMGRLPYLKHLNLSYNMLGERGTSALAYVLNSGQLPGLTHLLLSRCYLDNGVVQIAQAMETGRIIHLRVLDLSCNDMGVAGSGALAKALESGKVSKLLTLIIAECGIAPDRIELIAQAIEIGHVWGLRHLDLSKNSTFVNSVEAGSSSINFRDNSPNSYTSVRKDLGSWSLARLIKKGHLAELQYLNLSQCGMTDDGLIALAEEMEVGHLPKLQSFFLSDNDIRSGRTMKALVRALVSGHLSELQELDLGHNRIGDDVTMALITALEETGSESQSPVVKELKERLWSSKSPLERFRHHLLRSVETHLGLKFSSMGQQQHASTGSIWNRYLQPQSSQGNGDDENQESTDNHRKLFFNVLLVCVWILAMVVSKW